MRRKYSINAWLGILGLGLVVVGLGACREKNEQTQEAKRVYDIDFLKDLNAQIDASPEEDSLLLYRAKLLLDSKYKHLAEFSCEEAWKIKPTVAAAVCKYEALTALGNYEKAIAWLKTCLRVLGKDNRLFFLLAEGYKYAGQPDQVLPCVQRMDTTRWSPALSLEVAHLLSDVGAYADALRFLNLGINEQSDLSFYLMKGYLLIQLKHPHTLAFLNSLTSHSDYAQKKADVWYLWGSYYDALSDESRAFAYYEKTTKEDWRFQSAYVAKAQILKKQKKYKQALEQLYVASEVDAPTPTLLEESGDCFLALKDTAEAMSYYENAYHLDSTRTTLVEKLKPLKSL